MLFGRRRRRDATRDEEMVEAAGAAQNAPMSGSEPWLAHGLVEGDTAACESCGRRLKARLEPRAAVIVSYPGALAGRILICGGCGRLVCRECTAGARPGALKCGECGAPVVIPMS